MESWDGERWRSERLPASTKLVLNSVSCPDASFCEVVGEQVGPGPGATLAPLAEAWDGTSWHEQPMLA